MLAILLILPLVVAAFIALLMKKTPQYAKYVAFIGSILSLWLIFLAYMNQQQYQQLNWFSLGAYTFSLSTSTAPLNMILLFIVGIMTPLVITYSMGYMDIRSEQPRYYFELCIFAAAMMLFAISGDFLTMFIGWELLGVTSYLLIGFWYKLEGAAQSARKAITTILIGDIMMFAALLIIWSTYHTFTFAIILQQVGFQNTAIEVSLILIMLAAFTKSAQFPFHEWLPDAMKGPTPVSSFLHSSTMVKAGIFIVAVLLPLFIAYHLLNLLLIFGIITAILGALNALSETHIKRILAYSTIEDLGLMFIALGTGSLIAAMLLFVVQTFYKALLFMGAGSIIKANDGEENIENLYNSGSHLNILIPIIIGVISLAGIFPLGGFFGKAAVSASSNVSVYIVLIIIAFISNLYIFRWLFVPLRTKFHKNRAVKQTNFKTLPKSMIAPMYILAVLVLISGLAYFYVPKYLSSYSQAPPIIGITEILISSVIAVIAFLISYKLFYSKDHSAFNQKGILYKLLYNNLIINGAYKLLAQAMLSISVLIDRFDHTLYNFTKDCAYGFSLLGERVRKAENGNINTYLAFLIIGLIVILLIFVL
jgi:NADH-quinone oxidoreductase subunit L